MRGAGQSVPADISQPDGLFQPAAAGRIGMCKIIPDEIGAHRPHKFFILWGIHTKSQLYSGRDEIQTVFVQNLLCQSGEADIKMGFKNNNYFLGSCIHFCSFLIRNSIIGSIQD